MYHSIIYLILLLGNPWFSQSDFLVYIYIFLSWSSIGFSSDYVWRWRFLPKYSLSHAVKLVLEIKVREM